MERYLNISKHLRKDNGGFYLQTGEARD